uniref:Amino acid transporter n=1 Tax=Timema genevievae TaxID=629358 RepID=A0A7R9JY46_TIMGE|nr:unnamed protein product [Timema genevievae]
MPSGFIFSCECICRYLQTFTSRNGMAQLDARCSGRMGMRALIYYITTTVLAAIVGILMVLMIHPGDPRIKTQVEGASTRQDVSTLDAILDIVRNLFPDNLMQACFQQVQTTYKKVPQALVFHGPNISGVATPEFIMKRSLVYKDGTNVMGELNDQRRIASVKVSKHQRGGVRSDAARDSDQDHPQGRGMIVFCLAFGLLAGQMGPKGRLMVDFFVVLNDIIMKLVGVVMW